MQHRLLPCRHASGAHASGGQCAAVTFNGEALWRVPQDLVIDEVLVMKRTRHRNILPLHAAFVDEHYLWMVMPFCMGGSLEKLLRTGYPKVLPPAACCCCVKGVWARNCWP